MSSPSADPPQPGYGEQEPLLGRPGDVSQREDRGLASNLILGTAVIAQAGIWILVALVWAAVFSHDVIFFSAHPLLNSAGILLITQGALILQPTHTQKQKIWGTYVHHALNGLGLTLLLGGLIVIEINKFDHKGKHFNNTHAILGIITASLLIIQAIIGTTQFHFPILYGGEQNAKKIYKYHRISGYIALVLSLATIAAATQTYYNKMALHIHLWPVLLAEVLLLAGILPRIKKQKLGL